MFRVAVGVWSIAPREFWAMTMREFWWMFDVRRPPPPKVGRSGFTQKEVKRAAEKQRELDSLLEGVTDKAERRRIVQEFVKHARG